MIKTSIANCTSDDERQRLMKQYEQYEIIVREQLQNKQDIQNQKLKDAIQARNNRRKKLMNDITEEKQTKIFKEFRDMTNNTVNSLTNTEKSKMLAKRIQAGFSKDEAVQVTENYIDGKNQQELTDLMNSLFEERAKALRRFILELLTQKQNSLLLLSQEIEPQKELLR